MKYAVLVFCLIATGCGLKAPDVTLPKSVTSSSAFGSTEFCSPAESGKVICRVSMARPDRGDASDRWVYWKAGSTKLVYRPSGEFVVSGEWDMRVTKEFPLVGTNGGKTASDEGFPQGKAAFAVMPDSRLGYFPTTVAEVMGLNFVADRYEALEFNGARLGEEYQNPLVNAIGPGLLADYSPNRGHSVTLSHRVFILRASDGISYYAIHFKEYSRSTMVATFEWRKLQ